MKKIMLIVFISVTLFSQTIENEFIKNPTVYSSLGDEIYNSLSNINNLKKIESYNHLLLKIHKYTVDVQETKKLGYALESGEMLSKDDEYLEKLRELSKVKNYFYKMADGSFKSSIENNDSKLFQNIVNTGMVDIEANKDQIISYYKAHSDDINSSGVIQDTIDKQEAENLKKKVLYKNKKKLNKDKVVRYREAQKRKEEAIEKKLEEELLEKKEKIRQEQEKQLFLNSN